MNTQTITENAGTEGAPRSLFNRIAKHPFLRGLSPDHLDILADCAMATEFEADRLVFRESEVANRFYLIEDGQVALETTSEDGGATQIQTVGAGDVLGWSWLFPPYHWQFDARALTPTKAIFFYGTRLRERCEQDHELGYELMARMSHVLIQRLQATRKELRKHL